MYTFYEDPGHGWLRVPKSEIMGGLEYLISPYSRYIYLEEDCDLSAFADWKGIKDEDWQAWWAMNVKKVYSSLPKTKNDYRPDDETVVWDSHVYLWGKERTAGWACPVTLGGEQ